MALLKSDSIQMFGLFVIVIIYFWAFKKIIRTNTDFREGEKETEKIEP